VSALRAICGAICSSRRRWLHLKKEFLKAFHTVVSGGKYFTIY